MTEADFAAWLENYDKSDTDKRRTVFLLVLRRLNNAELRLDDYEQGMKLMEEHRERMKLATPMTDAELNAAMAEMMGWKQPDHYPVFIGGSIKRKKRGWWEPWTPATNIAQAMGEVVPEMRARGWRVNIYIPSTQGELVKVYMGHRNRDKIIKADKAPECAICIAALAAHNARGEG